MDLFGLAPTSDPLLLVVCSRCARHIKASRFAGHFERCSKREEEDKLPPKRMRLEVTEDDVVQPTDSPKRVVSSSGVPGKAKPTAAPSQSKRSSTATLPPPSNGLSISSSAVATSGTGAFANSVGGRRKSDAREWSGSESDSSGDESGNEISSAMVGVAVLLHAGAWAVAPLRTRLYSRPNPLRRAPPLPPTPSMSMSLSSSTSSLAPPSMPFHTPTYYSTPVASALGPAHHAAAPALKPNAAMVGVGAGVAASMPMRKLTSPTPMPPKLASVGAAAAVRTTDLPLDVNVAKKMGDIRKPAAAMTGDGTYGYAPGTAYAPAASGALQSPTSGVDYSRTASIVAATRAVGGAPGMTAMGVPAPMAATAKAVAKTPVPLPLSGATFKAAPLPISMPMSMPMSVSSSLPSSVPVPIPLPLSVSVAAPSPLPLSGTPSTMRK